MASKKGSRFLPKRLRPFRTRIYRLAFSKFKESLDDNDYALIFRVDQSQFYKIRTNKKYQ